VNSYWQLPARLFDDQEDLCVWARAALAAAQRASLRKRPKPRKAARKVVAKKVLAKKIDSAKTKPAAAKNKKTAKRTKSSS